MSKLFLNGIELSELLDAFREIVREENSSLQPKIQPKETKYYKRKEVASKLNISLVTLSDWQKKGLINFRRIKSRVFFTQEDIDAAMNLITRNSSL